MDRSVTLPLLQIVFGSCKPLENRRIRFEFLCAFAGSAMEALGVEPSPKPCARRYRSLPPLSTTVAAGLQTRLERHS